MFDNKYKEKSRQNITKYIPIEYKIKKRPKYTEIQITARQKYR